MSVNLPGLSHNLISALGKQSFKISAVPPQLTAGPQPSGQPGPTGRSSDQSNPTRGARPGTQPHRHGGNRLRGHIKLEDVFFYLNKLGDPVDGEKVYCHSCNDKFSFLK